MAVPRDNKRKFVSSANNLEVENGKNDNSNADQNNPEKNAAANKVSQSAFGNGNANNLFDEMRNLLTRIEQNQIDQARMWRKQSKVFEKMQEKEAKMLRPKLCVETDLKQEIWKARSAGTIRIENGINNAVKTVADYSNLNNGNEWKQLKLGIEKIVQKFSATQQNTNNKNMNCGKNAKEQPKIDKIIPTIKQSFKSPPNQQPTFEIQAKNKDIIGNEFGLKICPVPVFQCQSNPFRKFDKKEPDMPNKQITIRQKISDNNIIQNLPMNQFVPVEGTHFLAERGRFTHQFKKFPTKIIPKMNIGWFGNGCMQLKWNFFPSVKPKYNEKIIVWRPPLSFRIFADFAKHDWSMIAKSPTKWNLGKIGWQKIGYAENLAQFHENVWEPSWAFPIPILCNNQFDRISTQTDEEDCLRMEALSEDGGM